LRFIELFAGIGGFRYGLERANDNQKTRGCRQKTDVFEQGSGDVSSQSDKRQYSFTCVYANEIDKYACKIYRKNYGNEELTEGDIRAIPAKAIPNHDMLTAGFPCQSFSIAGKRKGFKDTRGTLFFEICRIAEEKQPSFLLLENVKGILNHESGKTFGIILDSLSELGYDCEWQVHNSKNFGVPQNRERVFIIGYRRGAGRGKIFPLQEDDRIFNEKNKTNQRPSQARYSRTLRGTEMKADHTFILQNNKAKAITPKTRAGDTFILNNKLRRLTPTECERLQGFPDGWTEGISDTQRYKCLGNAVTTNVITEIGKAIIL